jgi:hypothetical protein
VPRRVARPLVALALWLAAASCRPARDGAPPERFLPGGVELAVVVPEAGRAARELAALHGAASRLPGAGKLAQARGALTAQLGFDPLDPESLADAGVDASRGAALGELARGSGHRVALLILPVRDAPRLQALFARLARERLAAPERSSEPRSGGSVVVFRAAPGAPPALAYGISAADRIAVVAPGPAGPDAVAEALARAPPDSLAASPSWQAARKALGDRYAATLFAPPGSTRLSGLPWARDGMALGASADARSVRLAAGLLLGGRAASFRALAAHGAAGKVVRRLDPTAPLALRWDGDFAALGERLAPLLPAPDRARLAARGLDAERDVFGLLAPGGGVVLSLSQELSLESLSGEELRSDPLRLVRFEAVAKVKDEARAREVLERLAGPPGAGRRARARGGAPAEEGRIVTPSGEIAWRLSGKRLAVAGGPPGALDALVARLDGRREGGFAAPTPAAAAALEGGLGGAVLDTRKLERSVRALPDEAFGSGPSGFVVRSVVERFLEPAARLAAISARADLAEAALVVRIEIDGAGLEGAER